jgi:hypothetical protein
MSKLEILLVRPFFPSNGCMQAKREGYRLGGEK